MSDQPKSLILAPPEQPGLPGVPAPAFFAALEAKGEFTGDRLFHQRPDTYKAVVVLLGQKLGVIKIGKLLGVSPNTVMAVRDREGATIDIVKDHLARSAHEGATLISESICTAMAAKADNAHLLSIRDLKDLAVVYGILVQNGQLLAGQPTARVELSDLRKPEHDDFNDYISKLPQANVIHLEGEKLAQKEGGALPGSVAAGPAADAAPEPTMPAPSAAGSDSQSEGQTEQVPANKGDTER